MATNNTKFTLYKTAYCPYCRRTIDVINQLDIPVNYIDINDDIKFRKELIAGGGKAQVPCLKINKDGQEHWLYESADIIKLFNQLANDA